MSDNVTREERLLEAILDGGTEVGIDPVTRTERLLYDIAKKGGGLPAGGTAGQVLTKKTDADRDVEWKAAGTPEAPSEDGDYELTASVSEGEATVGWSEKAPPAPTRYYAVTFMNGDVVFEVQIVPEGGDAATPGGIPVKESTEEHTYVFIGWRGSLSNITKPTMIHAVFEDIGAYISISTPVIYTARKESEFPPDTSGALSTAVKRQVSYRAVPSTPVPPNKSWIYSTIEIPDTMQNLVGVALNVEFDLTAYNARNDVSFSTDVLDLLREYNGAVWYKKNENTIPNYVTLASSFNPTITRDQTNNKIFHFNVEFTILFGESIPSDNLTIGIYTGWTYAMCHSNNTYEREVDLNTTVVSAGYIPITAV